MAKREVPRCCGQKLRYRLRKADDNRMEAALYCLNCTRGVTVLGQGGSAKDEVFGEAVRLWHRMTEPPGEKTIVEVEGYSSEKVAKLIKLIQYHRASDGALYYLAAHWHTPPSLWTRILDQEKWLAWRVVVEARANLKASGIVLKVAGENEMGLNG